MPRMTTGVFWSSSPFFHRLTLAEISASTTRQSPLSSAVCSNPGLSPAVNNVSPVIGLSPDPKFTKPVPFRDQAGKIIQPGGAHETGAVGTMLGGEGPNLLICNEAGRLFLLPGKNLRTEKRP